MNTGDLKNNLRKFHAELKRINYTGELDIEGLSVGRPSALLPILHFVITEFSLELAQYFYSKDYELLGKNDVKFLQVVYRLLRDEFDLKPPMTKDQFFTLGFTERKLQFVTGVIQVCREKSRVLKPKKKKTAIGSKTNSTTATAISDSDGSPPSFGSTNVKAFQRDKSPKEESHRVSTLVVQDENVFTNAGDVSRSFLASHNSKILKNDCNSLSLSTRAPLSGNCPKTFQFPTDAISLKSEPDYHACNMEKMCMAKENMSPNTGDYYNSMRQCTNGTNAMLSPIPISSRVWSHNYNRSSQHSGLKWRNEQPFVNHSDSSKYSKHIFAFQPGQHNGVNEGIEGVQIIEKNTSTNEGLLQQVKEQENRIDQLKKQMEQRDGVIQELIQKNSELSARVMVLETTVALLQEET